jgi:hypothetical protein
MRSKKDSGSAAANSAMMMSMLTTILVVVVLARAGGWCCCSAVFVVAVVSGVLATRSSRYRRHGWAVAYLHGFMPPKTLSTAIRSVQKNVVSLCVAFGGGLVISLACLIGRRWIDHDAVTVAICLALHLPPSSSSSSSFMANVPTSAMDAGSRVLIMTCSKLFLCSGHRSTGSYLQSKSSKHNLRLGIATEPVYRELVGNNTGKEKTKYKKTKYNDDQTIDAAT